MFVLTCVAKITKGTILEGLKLRRTAVIFPVVDACAYPASTRAPQRTATTDLQAGKNKGPSFQLHLWNFSVFSNGNLDSFLFPFCFHLYKWLWEGGVKAGRRFAVVLRLLTCSTSEINQQGKICAMPVGIKLRLAVQGGNAWFLSPFAAGTPFPTSTEKWVLFSDEEMKWVILGS